jgi:hypothetical protein
MVAVGDAAYETGEYNVRMACRTRTWSTACGIHDAEWAGKRRRTLVRVMVAAPVHKG